MSKLSNVERISLIEEIRYLASLDHPNIVRYYEAFIEKQWLCIITELVLGGDVSRLIRWARMQCQLCWYGCVHFDTLHHMRLQHSPGGEQAHPRGYDMEYLHSDSFGT